MAEAIVKEACPVWDEGVINLIDTAYAKFYQPKDEQFVELSEEQKAAIPAALFKPWVRKDLTQIPYPEFVYSDFYARGYTSVTLAPPKVGKSMLGLAEAIDIATGRGILTGQPRPKQKVVYYNAEDDQDVIDSRVAALLSHYGIDQSEIEGWLWPTSGVELDDFVMITGQDGIINEALFISIEKFIAESGADALVFDPLQDLSHSPETNEVFRLLGQRLRRMASTSRVALGLIHHTRKIAPGVTPTIDDGRGGSALRGTARFNRLLIGMTEDEAAKAGLDNHRHYLRIADMESNLAPPSADVNRWFQKVSVQTPNGRHVGAVEAWKWPDAFDGVTKQDAARVRAEIDKMTEPPRADVRSASWVGNIVADVLGLNITKIGDKAKVKSITAKWIETDVLRIAEGKDPRAGRTVNVVICGANNPLSEGGQQ
jgi:RecA-family ATPase